MPAAIIYKYKKSMRNAVIGMVVGIISLTIISSLLNYYVMLPLYAKVFGMSIEELVAMGTEKNRLIIDLRTYVLFAVVPFNLLKGLLSSLVTFFLYKKISPVLDI